MRVDIPALSTIEVVAVCTLVLKNPQGVIPARTKIT